MVGGYAWQGGVCGGVCAWCRACMAGGHVWQGACMVEGGGLVWHEGACMAGEMATAADGTYPTEMHSCLKLFFYQFKLCHDFKK